MGDMESSSRIVLHFLFEIRRLGSQGVVLWRLGKSATQFISCSITEVTMMMARALMKLSMAWVRSPVAQGGVSRCWDSGVRVPGSAGGS